MSKSIIGQGVRRSDALDKVTGRGLFTSDLSLPGMLHAKVLRSPHPHARIVKLDVTAAEKIPGVRAIAHAGNTTQNLFNASAPMFTTVPGQERVLDQRIFDNVVRYVGDEVAAVAADTVEAAEAAIAAIKVEYEPLPTVYDPRQAMLPHAPELHPGKGVTPCGRNIPGEVVHLEWGQGDMEAALAACDIVIDQHFTLPIVKQVQLETQAAVAQVDGSGKITVWSTSQTPHPSRFMLASIFDVPASKVRVLAPPYIGGGFGVRIGLSAKAEPIAVALALQARRPVKLVYSREEDFIASDTRHGVYMHVRLGADKNGTFKVLDLAGVFDTGAYCSLGVELPGVAGAMALAIYNFERSRYHGHSVYTNHTSAGAMRGFGNPQSNLALERCVDLLAEKLGLDPKTLRDKNAMRKDEKWFLPYPCSSSELRACMEKAAAAVGWKRRGTFPSKGHMRRGLGMAVGTHVSNAWPFCVDYNNAYITVQVDGSIHVSVGVPEIGSGSGTSLAQIAAQSFGVPLCKVHVNFGDTESTPFDIGSHASRTLYTAGLAVKLAAEDARNQLLALAREASGLFDLTLEDGVLGVPGAEAAPMPLFLNSQAEAVNLADFMYHVHTHNKQIIGVGRNVPPNAPPWHCCAVDLSVDTETGRIIVHKMASAHDVGTAINPLIVEGQIEGGMVQGLGYALTEEITYDAGGRQNQRNLHTYMVPTASDVPELEPIIVESHDDSGPFGAKGAGECSLVCPASAIANAVSNALGVPVNEIPLTPERVLKLLGKM